MPTRLDIVIPVLNEESALPLSVEKLHEFLSQRVTELAWRIVVADNGSSDSTPAVAGRLIDSYPRVRYLRLELRGRGRALRTAWLDSDADILAYMDVDLSTDLGALPRLLDAVHTGGYDIAVGSRLKAGAEVAGRPLRREIISRAYSLIFRTMFLARFKDAQCGFKVLSRRAVDQVVPLVRDTGWFFDTELLILAEKNGYPIKEIPVRWTDDPDSRVRIVSTAYEDLKGLIRLRFGGLRRASRALAQRGEEAI